MNSDDPVAVIAQRAATLGARRRAVREQSDPLHDVPAERSAIDGVLAPWIALVAPDAPEHFDTRLRWAGLSRAQAARLTASASLRLAQGETDATWVGTFRSALGSSPADIAARFASADVAAAADILRADDGKPFEVLMLPFVAHARRALAARLRARQQVAARTASTDVIASWERHLLHRLTEVCARALFAEFTAYRTRRAVDPLAALMAGGGGVPRGEYQRFVAEMAAGALFDFFVRYPVAARLTATVVGQWIDAASDFLAHLESDLPSLQVALSDGSTLGRAVSVTLGEGDTHDEGRAVAIVTFASGCRVVYKPRALQLEGLFSSLLRWLADRDPGALSLMAPRRVERDDHGWVAFVERRACTSIHEVQRFYERAGTLLALLYGIDGTDFHLENLIAHGEHPVLIDMEALLSHDLTIEGRLNRARSRDFEAVNSLVNNSVARTGLLPAFKLANAGASAVSTAGLAGDAQSEAMRDTLGWRHVNTDLMRMTVQHAPSSPQQNVPLLDTTPHYAGAYIEEIVRGFARGYRLLMTHGRSLGSPEGVLRGHGARSTRLIFRHTSLYGVTLLRSLNPDQLRDGARRFMEFDVLARPLLRLDAHPGLDRVLDAEHDALERLDVPLFTARADSRALSLPDGSTIDAFFDRSAIDQAVHRLESLDESDLAQQCEFIRMSFNAGGVVGLVPPLPDEANAASDVAGATTAFGRRAVNDSAVHGTGVAREIAATDAIEMAERVAHDLLRMSVVSGAGRAWYGLEYLSRVRRHRLMPMGHGLMDGHGGLALFFAALARVTDDARMRDAAHQAMTSAVASLDAITGEAGWREVGPGLANGLGSALRLHVLAASVFDDTTYLRAAEQLCERVAVRTIASDAHDLLGGSAGAIVGLLDVHGATGSEVALARALEFGGAMLKQRTAIAALEVGMAHGTLGVALAAQRLGRATGQTPFTELADALRESARVAVRESAAALPSPSATHSAPSDWANGAGGLLLAELDAVSTDAGLSARSLRTPEIDALLAVCTTACAHPAAARLHGFATGDAGLMDVMVVSGEVLQDPSLRRSAAGLAARVREEVRVQGRVSTGWAPGFTHPGLLTGVTGVGYAMLRVAAPERVPSVVW